MILYCLVCYLISLGMIVGWPHEQSIWLGIVGFIFAPILVPFCFGSYLSQTLNN